MSNLEQNLESGIRGQASGNSFRRRHGKIPWLELTTEPCLLILPPESGLDPMETRRVSNSLYWVPGNEC